MSEDDGSFFPLEVVIAGTPRSLGASARSRDRWKRTVRAAALATIAETDDLGFIDTRCLAATMFYFPAGPMEGDIDNIVKPILDALVGAVYFDDRLIERVLVQKFEPDVDRVFSIVTDKLAEALNAPPPCLYIRIDDDLGWRSIA